MPGFSMYQIGGTGSSQGEFFRQRRRFVVEYADSVINKCNSFFQKNSNQYTLQNLQFAKALTAYLNIRKGETFDVFLDGDITQINKRTIFINRLLIHVSNHNVAAQLEMLREENIRCFKGFFSHRLYDILSKRRNALQNTQKQKMGNQKTKAIPVPVSAARPRDSRRKSV